MKTYALFVSILLITLSCSNKEDDSPMTANTEPTGVANNVTGCPDAYYQPWESSNYVLPYPVGTAYKTYLSHCTNSYHSEGEPDEFAIDFQMRIGTLITAARRGVVVHVVESGFDGEHPNNLVVVEHPDNTYAQYMHLTRDGAIREIGDTVEQGDSIGYSGATGLAGYPHLHFVVTEKQWEYPYKSIPYNFKNTTPNPRSLRQGTEYPALPY